jgi:uncharacterized ferritin-like protein (DUF455 family)
MEKIDINDYLKPWTQPYRAPSGVCTVFTATPAPTKQERVIERLEIQSFNVIDDYYNEVITHVYASPHSHIVKIIGRRCLEEIDSFTQLPKYYCIVLEKMTMSLKDEIQGRARTKRVYTQIQSSIQ